LYGTLLGAVREQDIIAHDGDTDLFMLQENWHTFSEILPEFLNAGFSLLQYNKNIITLFNNNEHIDIYFFSKYKDGIRKCNDFCLPEKFVTETVYISFLGEQFLVPKDYLLYLEFEYGQNWREPVVWDHLNPNPAMLFIKDALRRYFPFLHNLVKCCQGRKIRLIYIKKITQFRKIYKIEVAC
jgi:phosphorylcholine metabolism protein LicD